MTSEKVIEVLRGYEEQLRAMGIVPIRDNAAVDPLGQMSHVAWMCGEAIRFVEAGRIEKAHRWLGFIQGALWALGVTTVEAAKRANMPEGATFDAGSPAVGGS